MGSGVTYVAEGVGGGSEQRESAEQDNRLLEQGCVGVAYPQGLYTFDKLWRDGEVDSHMLAD